MDRFSSFFSDKVLTFSLVILILIVYPLELLIIAKWGIKPFEYWFLFTPGFLPTPAWIFGLAVHKTVPHLANNILGLLVYGLVLEQFISRKTYLGVYTLSGLLAGVIHTNLTHNTGAGASGAIFGLIGFYSFLYLSTHRPDDWKSIFENVRYLLALFGPIVVLVQVIIDFHLSTGSNNYAHVAGAAIGAFAGIIYVNCWFRSN